VVVVDDGGALDEHWRVEVVTETPDPEIHQLAPEFVDRLLATQKRTGLPWEVKDLETGLRMRLVPNGEFTVTENSGSDAGYRVLIAHPFYLSECEVTLSDWQRQLGGETMGPSDRPISNQSWEECRTYLRKARAALRFPNEFEWQWACTFGKDVKFAWPNEMLPKKERVNDASHWVQPGNRVEFPNSLLDVGRMASNPYGFRGMHGNAREWCLNPFDLDELIPEPDDRPIGGSAEVRSVRGGAASDDVSQCQAGARMQRYRGDKDAGLRVARSVASSRELLVREWPKDAKRTNDDVERPRPGEGNSTEAGGDSSNPGGVVEQSPEGNEGKGQPGGGQGKDGLGAVPVKPNGVGMLQGKNNGQNQGGGSGQDERKPAEKDPAGKVPAGEGEGRDGGNGKDGKDGTLPPPDAPIETTGT